MIPRPDEPQQRATLQQPNQAVPLLPLAPNPPRSMPPPPARWPELTASQPSINWQDIQDWTQNRFLGQRKLFSVLTLGIYAGVKKHQIDKQATNYLKGQVAELDVAGLSTKAKCFLCQLVAAGFADAASLQQIANDLRSGKTPEHPVVLPALLQEYRLFFLKIAAGSDNPALKYYAEKAAQAPTEEARLFGEVRAAAAPERLASLQRGPVPLIPTEEDVIRLQEEAGRIRTPEARYRLGMALENAHRLEEAWTVYNKSFSFQGLRRLMLIYPTGPSLGEVASTLRAFFDFDNGRFAVSPGTKASSIYHTAGLCYTPFVFFLNHYNEVSALEVLQAAASPSLGPTHDLVL